MNDPQKQDGADNGVGSTGGSAIPADQPKDTASGRYVCTRERPMPRHHGFSLWIHPDAKDDGRNDPYWDGYDCPNCNTSFKVEVAE